MDCNPRSTRLKARPAVWLTVAGMAMVCLLLAGCQRATEAASPDATAAAKPAAGADAKVARNTTTPDAPKDAWPVFRGDPLANGVAGSKLPDDPKVLWKFNSKEHGFEATVAIADGRVFAGCLDGELYVLSLEDGKELWRYHTELGFTAPAAVKDGRVFAGDSDGRFYCFDAATGKPQWGFEASAEINSGPNFYKDNVLFGSQDATLYCLNAATGDEVWTYTIGDQIRCSPTVVEGRAFLAGCDAKLHIVDLEKGEALATVEIDGPTGSTPAADDNCVYFGTENSSFFCINWREAKVEWMARSPRNMPFRSSAALLPEAVIFGGRDKAIYALDPKTGKELWKPFRTRSRVDSSPVIVEDRVYVGASDGRLYALDRKTGEKVWEYEAGGDFIASPAVAEGRLVIGNTDGTLYCFGADAK